MLSSRLALEAPDLPRVFTFMLFLLDEPTGHTTLLRGWSSVNDVDSTSQERRVPIGRGVEMMTRGGRTSYVPIEYSAEVPQLISKTENQVENIFGLVEIRTVHRSVVVV